MRKLYAVLMACFVGVGTWAQQLPEYTMYRFSGMYINPAYTGSHDCLNALAIYRHQWVKIPGAPRAVSVAAHAPFKKEQYALGGLYTYEQSGVIKTNSATANFAYRFKVGKKKNVMLSLGVSAGVTNYATDMSKVNVVDAGDENFTLNSQSLWLPDVGFGFYAYSDKFFAGIAVPHILANKLDGSRKVFATNTQNARQYHQILATAGYIFNLGKKVKFMPSALLNYTPVYAPVSADFNIQFIFIDRIWIGAGYRLKDAYNFMAAVNVTKQLKIGYAYDLNVSPLSKYTRGTHEVMLSFDALFQYGRVVSPRYVKMF